MRKILSYILLILILSTSGAFASGDCSEGNSFKQMIDATNIATLGSFVANAGYSNLIIKHALYRPLGAGYEFVFEKGAFSKLDVIATNIDCAGVPISIPIKITLEVSPYYFKYYAADVFIRARQDEMEKCGDYKEGYTAHSFNAAAMEAAKVVFKELPTEINLSCVKKN